MYVQLEYTNCLAPCPRFKFSTKEKLSPTVYFYSNLWSDINGSHPLMGKVLHIILEHYFLYFKDLK